MKNKNIGIQELSLLVALFFLSCHMYNSKEIIKRGEQVLSQNKEKLKKIIKISNEIAKDSCVMYKIMTSKTTDIFHFSEYKFNKHTEKIEKGPFLDISNKNKELIWKTLPYEYFSDFTFVKGIYVSFLFDHVRDKKSKYAKLIYFYDKETFKQLFSNYYTFYEKQTNIVENKKWLYFYDNHWAITTSSDMFRRTTQECKKMAP